MLRNFISYSLVTHVIFGFQYTNCIIHISDIPQLTKYFSFKRKDATMNNKGSSLVISTKLILLQVFELLSFTSMKCANQ